MISLKFGETFLSSIAKKKGKLHSFALIKTNFSMRSFDALLSWTQRIFFSQVRLNRNRVAKQFQLSMVGHIITKFGNRCSIPFWKKTKKIILNPKSKSTIAQSADNKFGSRWVVWLSNRPFFPQKKPLLVAFSFFFRTNQRDGACSLTHFPAEATFL